MTVRKYWTDSEMVEGILEVMNHYGIERMPTHKEINDFYGNSGLTNRITKTGGSFKWAVRLGFEMKCSDTSFGCEFENKVQEILTSKQFSCEMTGTRHPYDILVDGCVKVDVKAAKRSKVRGSDVFSFRLAKPQQTCDIYIAVCLSDDEEIEKIYIIPSHLLSGNTQLCIGTGHSKYDKYIDRWEIVEEFADFFRKIS